MSTQHCSHTCNQIKKKSETYYCDYCGKGSFIPYGRTESDIRYYPEKFPISIEYFRNNTVFHLDFHESCFGLFHIANKLDFCSICSKYYSKEETV